jgi:ankyrin repeat protein
MAVKQDEVRFDARISAAIRDKNLSALQQIMASEPRQISAFTPFAGGTWLHFAAREGNEEAVSYLLSRGMDVNVGDAREGRGALCDACLGGHANVTALLLRSGALIDTSDPVKDPLFSSIIGRSVECAKLLLDAGVDTTIAYSGGSMKQMTALAFAIERGEIEIATMIARFGASNEAEAQRKLGEAREVAQRNNSN